MNLFDFDKTIYKYDSTVRFWLYCMKIKPYIALGLPMQVFYTILYKLRLVSKEKYKSRFFFFVRYFKDIDLTVKNFWQKEKSNICEWFFKVKKPGDYVVSASPEFLLNEIAAVLDIGLIASGFDVKTRSFTTPNCRGQEKVRRLSEIGINTAEAAYSDSKSDIPMLKIAKKGYFVKNKTVSECVFKEFSDVKGE